MKTRKTPMVQAVALLLTLTMVLVGCGNTAATTSSATASSAPSSSDAALSKSDGQSVCAPVPEKIVSLAPANTQVLLALGLGDKLVAIDTYSALLPGLPTGLPQFDMMTPDAEALVALEADLILTTGMSSAEGTDPFQPIRDIGLTVYDVATPEDIQGIRDSLVKIGSLVGKGEDAQRLIDEMDATIAKVAAVGNTITEKKRVYFEIAAAPYAYSFGSGVYLDEMLNLLGAQNILAAEKSWLSVSEEAVLAADPQVILTNVDYLDDPVAELKARAGWGGIAAVKDGQVYLLPKNPTSLPNHTMAEGLVLMAKAIYPELYKDF